MAKDDAPEAPSDAEEISKEVEPERITVTLLDGSCMMLEVPESGQMSAVHYAEGVLQHGFGGQLHDDTHYRVAPSAILRLTWS